MHKWKLVSCAFQTKIEFGYRDGILERSIAFFKIWELFPPKGAFCMDGFSIKLPNFAKSLDKTADLVYH